MAPWEEVSARLGGALPLNDSEQIWHICSSITFILPIIPIEILTSDIELQPRVVV